MRHLFAILSVAALLLPMSALAERGFDFSGMTLDELYEARVALEQQIASLECENGSRLYGSGGYLVGRDIPAGDYVLYENDDAVFASAVIRAGEDEEADIVTYHLINRQVVIRLEPDTWLTLAEARACPLAQASQALESSDGTGEGGFLVGTLLPAGTYTVQAIEKAPLSSYSIYGDILDTGAQLLKFEVLHEAVSLELQAGEYIELSGCELVRP